jgi:predicted dehydrogenase
LEVRPAGVHYDLWLGPAPKHEFTRNRFHYNWHWFWDCGNGDLGNQGIHQIDTARWGLGVKYPTRVSAMGGHFMFEDDQETPNTLTATFEFEEGGKTKLLVFEVRHWILTTNPCIGEDVQSWDRRTLPVWSGCRNTKPYVKRCTSLLP